LLGIVLKDPEFHFLATDGVDIDVDLDAREVRVKGKAFGFQLDDMELALIEQGGIASAFRRFGMGVFEKLTAGEGSNKERKRKGHGFGEGVKGPLIAKELQW